MVQKTRTSPFGTWKSPITADLVSGASVSFKEIQTHPITGQVYLIEGRPSENGRSVIVEFKGQEGTDILPEHCSANTKVHEYGGGACAISPSDGAIIFNDGKTDSVFSLSASREVTEVIKGNIRIRFADFNVHPLESVWVLAIQEDHSRGEGRPEDVINTIVAINSETKTVHSIASGADFYSHPRFSPDGKRISWMQWNHPDMPWTGSELFIADWTNGKPAKGQYVAGKPKLQSICQPKWHLDGTLLFEDDRSGFLQLYRFDPRTKEVEYLFIEGYANAEFGSREQPLGNCTFAPLNSNEIVITYCRNAINGILLYNLATKISKELDTGLIDMSSGSIRRTSDTTFVVIGGTATAPLGLYSIDITKPAEKSLLRSTANIELNPDFLSKAKSIKFPRTHGKDQSGSAYAIFIPPQNPDFIAPVDSKPPLIVNAHSGPTSHVGPGLSLAAQYYTSRGYAYCYPNYAGSTGHGRKYREELDFSWGLKDCEDTVSCVDYLSSQGLIDASKVGITGESAGGYTTLQAMVTFPKVFAAGCSSYGVGNLQALAQETHKYESFYLFALLYPEGTTEEEIERLYKERSPCFHADTIERPLLMLQGTADKVVPIGQAIEMERVLKEKGRDVKLVIFEGEGHGFEMQKHLQRAIEEEEALWNRTLL